jgi:hypothetical protein
MEGTLVFGPQAETISALKSGVSAPFHSEGGDASDRALARAGNRSLVRRHMQRTGARPGCRAAADIPPRMRRGILRRTPLWFGARRIAIPANSAALRSTCANAATRPPWPAILCKLSLLDAQAYATSATAICLGGLYSKTPNASISRKSCLN